MGLRESYKKSLTPGVFSSSARTRKRIIIAEIVGFFVLVAISWLDEILEIPKIIFGEFGTNRLAESFFETIAILLVATPVILFNRSLLARMQELESFLRLCAWCKRVHGQEGWMPLDEFIASHTDANFTHGMCESCAQQMLLLKDTPRRGKP